jgi:DNA-binding CsgD family transcriptional regulator
MQNQGVLGFLELSLGNPAAAADYLGPAARYLHKTRWRDPLGDPKPNAIEALILVGELDQAAELLADLEDWSRIVDAPATRATAWRCRGLLCAAGGDHDGAREALAAALVGFQQLGVRLWAEQARAQLAKLGGRRPQGTRLTPTEAQIASLVAQGRTNQQVADALFVSPKTVEWNLSKVYKKLHVRSRAELAAKLARPAQG